MKRIKKSLHLIRKGLISVAISLTVGIFIVGSYILLTLYSHNRFTANTTVSGIDLSYKTPRVAKRLLTEHSDKLLNTSIKVTINEKTEEVMIQDLGLEVLSERTVSLLSPHNAKNKNFLDFYFSKKERSLPLLTKINYEKLDQTLEEKFQKSEIEPQNATYYFKGRKLHTQPDKDGLKVNLDKLTANLNTIAESFTPQDIQIELINSEADITYDYLLANKSKMSSFLTHPFELIDPVYNENWIVRLANEQDWVKFVEKNGDIEVEIQEEGIERFIDEKISKWLDLPADDVDIFKDENGKIVINGRGNDGLKIQREELKLAIKKAVPQRLKKIPIPVEKTTPKITISQELQDLGITNRIGLGHTSYYGSPANRVHNIKVGAARFNGKLIAPGEVFSFNQNLGRVDATTGYRKELVIKPEGTIPEYGGGICQVSTTMYRAALLSGIDIAERNQHSYAVSYYSQILGHGLDATIYLGGADLKITNTTQGHILIQTYIKNDYEIYFVFYGTPDGRSVELDGPYLANYKRPGETVYQKTDELPEGEKKQVEKAHTGFDAVWYRYVTDSEGNTTKEPIVTKYKAVPAKILVGGDVEKN